VFIGPVWRVDTALGQRAGVHRRPAVHAEQDAAEDEVGVAGRLAALALLDQDRVDPRQAVRDAPPTVAVD
jgi:hypothetical protein